MKLLQLVQENALRHRIVVNPKIKFEYKSILVYSLLSLQLPADKRSQQVNGVRRRKRSQIRNSESFQQNPTIHRQPPPTQRINNKPMGPKIYV